MNKIYAPFTAEQVARLKEWQSGMMWQQDTYGIERPMPTHPFTCAGEKRSECPNEGELIPDIDGWRCPCGKYEQNWCYDFMAVYHEPSDLSKLFKSVLLLAEAKGYPLYGDLINPFGLNFWDTDGMLFVSVVCVLLDKWLRETFNILVWVEPKGRVDGKHYFAGFCDSDSQDMGLATIHIPKENEFSYEYVWLAGIEHALKILPPAASQ